MPPVSTNSSEREGARAVTRYKILSRYQHQSPELACVHSPHTCLHKDTQHLSFDPTFR